MAWFSKGAPPPDELRKQLFDAAAHGHAELVKLVSKYEKQVLEHALSWAHVPERYRGALDWYAQGMTALAKELARRGYPQLIERVSGGDNPVVDWQRGLEYVRQCIQQGDFREGGRAAKAILERVQGLVGTAVDLHLPATYGMLSYCLFNAGEVEAAREPLEEAVTLFEKTDQHDGLVTALEQLYELQRYRGHAEAAADTLERLARILQGQARTSIARSCSRQAAIVRRGEPLCRVVCEVAGERLEVDDLPRGMQDLHVQFQFVRNRPSLGLCGLAVQRAMQSATAGDLRSAVDLLERAAAIDGFDPAPHYQRGVVLLHLQRYAEAQQAFAKTESLAPGYFHVRTDLWLSERLDSGALPHSYFLLLRQLQDGSVPADQVVKRVAEALEHKRFALLYLIGGNALRALDRKQDAEQWYRDGLAIAEEGDVRTRLLTALGTTAPELDERMELLTEAVALAGNLVAAALASLMLRTEMPERALH